MSGSDAGSQFLSRPTPVNNNFYCIYGVILLDENLHNLHAMVVLFRYDMQNWESGVCDMEHPKKHYLYAMLTLFCAISLSVSFFFLLRAMPQIKTALDKCIHILAPFIYGAVIAYLLRPACNRIYSLMRRYFPKRTIKFANAIAVITSILMGILFLYALVELIVPQLFNSIFSIWATLPGKADQLFSYLYGKFSNEPGFIQFLDKYSDILYASVDDWVKTTVLPNLSNIVTGVGTGVWSVVVFLKNFLIGFIVAVYLLYHRRTFKRQGVMLLHSILKPRWEDALFEELRFIDRLFGGFVAGKLLDSGIIGVLCYLGCLIFRFPNALLVSFIVGITNVIPFFGPFIGAVPATLLILLEDPVKGLWFILFVLVLQQLDGNVIGPKILGNRTGLSGFWVMFAIVFFGGLWGLIGMVIGVPLMAVIYDLVRRFVHRRNGLEPHET